MNANADAPGGALCEIGGVLGATAGTSDHAQVSLLNGRGLLVLLNSCRANRGVAKLCFASGCAGGGAQGSEQQRDPTRDRCSEHHDLNPDPIRSLSPHSTLSHSTLAFYRGPKSSLRQQTWRTMDAPLAGIVGNNRLLANVDQQVHQQGRCN